MKCWFGSQCKDTNIFGSQRVIKNVGKLTSRNKKWHTFTNWFPGALVDWLPRPWLAPRGLVGSQEPWLIGSHGPWLAPRGLGCLLGALVERIPCSCLWSIAVTCTYTSKLQTSRSSKNKENKEIFTRIFFKILLLVIFVVVDIGLVVPETIQTKYSSTHFITHTHPPGGFLDLIQGGPKKWNSDYFWSRNLTFSYAVSYTHLTLPTILLV